MSGFDVLAPARTASGDTPPRSYPVHARRVRRSLLPIAALVVGACTPGAQDASNRSEQSATPAAGWHAARVDTLLRLGREDQAGREELARAAAAPDTATLFASMRADSGRTRWLRTAVARDGWPSRTTAGDSAQQAAWLIVQHSPDTAWQGALLPLLEDMANRGELPRGDVALLTDRILVQRGRPQRYGSQFDLKDGRLVPEAIEDMARLDERRASVGLPPMAEYVRRLAEHTKLPVVWPPRQ
jgi:hypothetical protein